MNTPQQHVTGGAGMTKWIYIIAVVLLVGWVAGFFVFHAGNEVHLLLLLSMTAILANIIRDGSL